MEHRVGGGAVPGHFVGLAVAEGVGIAGAAEGQIQTRIRLIGEECQVFDVGAKCEVGGGDGCAGFVAATA